MQIALTTIDNPYDPIEQFQEWNRFDLDKGYGTCSYLDRVSFCSDSLTDEENEKELERAIKEIIKYDFQGIYKVIRRED